MISVRRIVATGAMLATAAIGTGLAGGAAHANLHVTVFQKGNGLPICIAVTLGTTGAKPIINGNVLCIP
jgi:hypothetical protein